MSNIVQQLDMSPQIHNLHTKTKIKNFDDYMALPEINRHYEIIDGEIIMPPAHSLKHQLLLGRLFRLLASHVEKFGLGDVILAPFDIQISVIPFRTRQPDLLFISKERSGGGLDSSAGTQLLDVTPELVIEILSQTDTQKIIGGKLKDYQKIGVEECWLVNTKFGFIEVLKLSKNELETSDVFGKGDKLQSDVLPELDLQVDDVFA